MSSSPNIQLLSRPTNTVRNSVRITAMKTSAISIVVPKARREISSAPRWNTSNMQISAVATMNARHARPTDSIRDCTASCA